jgi:hypothetical protein
MSNSEANVEMRNTTARAVRQSNDEYCNAHVPGSQERSKSTYVLNVSGLLYHSGVINLFISFPHKLIIN